MRQAEAQRIMLEHRYRTDLPFPISTGFYQYSSSRDAMIRAQRLVRAAESTLRYAAIVAACDYASDPGADTKVLGWFRERWLGGKKYCFGDWVEGLLRVLRQSGKSWTKPFLRELSTVKPRDLERAAKPLVEARNRIIHGETHDRLMYKEFVKEHEDKLFTILEKLDFLGRYPMCVAEFEMDDGAPSAGAKQTIQVCRGASRAFTQYTVTPSRPIPPGEPFVWHLRTGRARRARGRGERWGPCEGALPGPHGAEHGAGQRHVREPG
jgi:hypothetical protein